MPRTLTWKARNTLRRQHMPKNKLEGDTCPKNKLGRRHTPRKLTSAWKATHAIKTNAEGDTRKKTNLKATRHENTLGKRHAKKTNLKATHAIKTNLEGDARQES